MAAERFPVMLDGTAYDHKPEGFEIGSITRRLQAAGPTEVTAQELAEAIRQGRTWTAGTFAPSASGWGAFQGVRLWALDIDNAEGRRQLTPNDSSFVWPETIRQRLVSLGFAPMLCHSTAHATAEAVRFRTVFDLRERITDEAEAREVITLILKRFPECDQACRNLNRLSFGAAGCGLYPYYTGRQGAWP